MKRIEKPHLITAATTHAGMSGKNNEDRYSITAYVIDNRHNTPSLLAVLSDGIGGHRAGEIAAEMVASRVSYHVSQGGSQDPSRNLVDAIHKTSREVHEEARNNSRKYGMGATCAAAWIIGNRLYTATVGDSRIYLLQGKRIRQISIDHTWVQEALEMGLLKPDQVVNHPNAHVIRRYMGAPKPPVVDTRMRLSDGESDDSALKNQGLTLQAGEIILLCSDGLTDLVDDREILNALQYEPLDDALQYLVNLANRRGGFDNITIIAIKVPVDSTPPRRKLSRLLPFLG